MAAKSVAACDIEVDKSVDFGITGLVQVLASGTRRGLAAVTDLAGYTTQELVTMANQGRNIIEETSIGLSAVSKMMMEHDRKAGDFDHTRAGALISLLTDLQSTASLIEANAAFELEQRGYTASGKYLAAAKAA